MLFDYPTYNRKRTLPRIPIILENENRRIEAIGLVDSGSSTNVLPYRFGLALGLVWESSQMRIKLTGNLANYPAQPVIILGEIGEYKPVRLSFAWSQTDSVPLILGNTNFFDQFEILFYRNEGKIEIKPNSLLPHFTE